MKTSVSLLLLIVLLYSCQPARQIGKLAQKNIINKDALSTAHVGISVYEPGAGRYLYNHHADKYFVPASNVKIATCYAAMKYLGKYLPGIRYKTTENEVLVQPTGDPTFLHPDFERQRVFDFLKNIDKKIVFINAPWQTERWGSGWAWDDYSDDFMAERSAFPIYGNVARLKGTTRSLDITPRYFTPVVVLDTTQKLDNYISSVKRDIAANRFFVKADATAEKELLVPFTTGNQISFQLLSDTLHKGFSKSSTAYYPQKELAVIHSQPTDSMLKPMMHNSDNFFAEQSLLMVSNQLWGSMNEKRIIDTLLKTEFSNMPQKPRWVDGSGLSRYNLFSPKDFIFILQKIQAEFGMERVREVFPSGEEGTLKNYFTGDSAFIYAKTGTLSGVVALSGYLYTSKNKLLLFSVLVNNHQASATEVRRAVEQFLQGVRKRY